MPQRCDAGLLKREGQALLDLFPRDAEVFKPVEQLVLHDGGDDLAVHVLKDGTDDAGEIGEAAVRGVEGVHAHGAVEIAADRMGDDAAETVREGGFARARRADDAEERAVWDRERDVVKRIPVRAGVSEGESLQLDHGILLSESESDEIRRNRKFIFRGLF